MSDLIKREDAIKAIAEVLSLNRFSSFKDIKNFDKFAERMLRNVPSVQPTLYGYNTEPIPHDDYIETENDHLEARCLNCNNAKACKEKHWKGCVYESQTSKIIEAYAKGFEDGAEAVKAMPQTDKHKCRRCLYYDIPSDYYPCVSCVDYSNYTGEVEDDPQTERSE